jgi:quinone-modifying oxidoreductase subunit QmoA
MNNDAKPILVIGGGIAGMTTALEAAEVGYRVVLVEKDAYLGGRVVRSYRYFPKMCPPICGFEINSRRIRQNPRIKVFTLSTVERIAGEAGSFKVKLRVRPRYVTGTCTLDDSIADQLTSERPDEFNLGVGTTKALYMPHHAAYPHLQVIDREALSEADREKLLEIAPPGSVDLEMTEEEKEIEVGAVVVATGWQPYDATKLETLGFGKYPNVITNVMMERLAAGDGPTGGEIVRPSDGKKVANMAFVQCAGSRDENHLPYCSAVCCMASLKQVRYLRDKNEDAQATVFYIDIRTIGRQEKYYYDMLEDEKVSFFKGKVAEIAQVSDDGDLRLEVEDTIAGEKPDLIYDMVVLATGVLPNPQDFESAFELNYDEYGFLDGTTSVDGIFVAGCAKRPCDVSRTTKDATAAALKAIQCLNRGR